MWGYVRKMIRCPQLGLRVGLWVVGEFRYCCGQRWNSHLEGTSAGSLLRRTNEKIEHIPSASSEVGRVRARRPFAPSRAEFASFFSWIRSRISGIVLLFSVHGIRKCGRSIGATSARDVALLEKWSIAEVTYFTQFEHLDGDVYIVPGPAPPQKARAVRSP